LTLIIAAATMLTACSKEEETLDPDIQYKKIDQILSGWDLQNVSLSTDFTWVGERLTKVEEIESGVVYERTEISYVGSSNTQIAEINIFSEPEIDDYKAMRKAKKAIQLFYKSKNKSLELQMKMVPVYTNNKVTRIDIYADDFFDKTLPHVAYIALDYTSNNLTKMSVRVLNPMVGVNEIEVMQMHAIWNNGNITTSYSKMLNFENLTQGFVTIDSTICTFDNKINAFSAIKAYPMIDPQLLSKNNILTQASYGLNWMNETLQHYSNATSTYVYNADNYPISSVENETVLEYNETYTWARKFEYLP
jgi:hypothetical protein